MAGLRYGDDDTYDPLVMCTVLEIHHSFETHCTILVTGYGNYVDMYGCIKRVTTAFPDSREIHIFADSMVMEVYKKDDDGEWDQFDPYGALQGTEAHAYTRDKKHLLKNGLPCFPRYDSRDDIGT